MELAQRSLVSSPDNKRTMTPGEVFDSKTATTDYAINALSHPNDNTYRKNLARYLDSKGFDLISKDRQLYIGDRNSNNMKPVTKNFLGDMIGSSPEIGGSILGGAVGFNTAGPIGASIGAIAGAVGGDTVQQLINNYFLGEELTTGERTKELGKSAALGAAGELGGAVVGRAVTPLRDFSKATQNANLELAGKYDVPLTPATATGHTGLANFEETMSKGTLGGKSIVQMKEAEIEGIENTAKDLLENKMGAKGSVSDSGASFAYETGKRQEEISESFNNAYGALVNDAGITEIPVISLQGAAKEILDLSEKIPAFKNGIDTLAERILASPRSLSYEEYGQLRTFIGAKIKDASVTGQTGSKEAYKKLYGAINNDFDEVFKGTSLWNAKKSLDDIFKNGYKVPFEDSFTRGVLGTSRNKIDEERIGGLIANSSGKAKTAARTADSAIGKLFPNGVQGKPVNTMSTAADYILGKSVAQDGGMSLAKLKTNLGGSGSLKGSGVDELFKIDNKVKATGGNTLANADQTNLKVIKDDLVKLIELSGANKKVANTSGTAWMNEMIRMKNDPMSALIGFFSDQTISRAYRNKTIQKWLTNDIISSKQAQQLIDATSQTAVRSGGD